MPRKIDLTGMKFGRLVVLKELPEKRGKNIVWLCECECGRLKKVSGNSLREKSTVSCGDCPVNKYFEKDGYMIGLTSKCEEFYFNKADFDLIKQYAWYLKDNYPSSNVNGKLKKMHRLIMPETKEIDHINGIPYDNRRENLRSVNHSQNMMNKRKAKNPKSSIYKGVSWHKQGGKWTANIAFNRNQIYLGCFTSEKEAALIYNKAASFYFGEYARLNVIQSSPVYHACLPHAHEKELIESLI
ncbi:putative Numod4 motif family protein [Candidatus Desulfosporosinus infrequens]|uniref:Putative Numod4 motif family protein n=1 Tax=Candidatus Desulfosporosinus infrequens TaxID=2043169 RepID=A0A2U3LNW5_9FIRM|nr:putative Numod4 motif family protein [Candidatus Desulfosporosinus infrequens]